MTRCFDKSIVLEGKTIRLRAAIPDDAEFVYALRTDPKRTKYLTRIEGTIDDQRAWLRTSYEDPTQVYFIITTRLDEPIGLVRVCDRHDDAFSWGSWIIQEDSPRTAALESVVLIYHYCLHAMGFQRAEFEVLTGNQRVIDFHKRFGATQVGQDSERVYFEIGQETIVRALDKFKALLPSQYADARD